MNKNLQNKIKTYAGVVSAILAADKASGQISFIDINPDTLVDASPANSGNHDFLLDIDNDGVSDFHFKANYQSGSLWNWQTVTVSPLDSNQILDAPQQVSHSDYFYVPQRMNSGDTIKSIANFSNVWSSHQNQWMMIRDVSSGWSSFMYGEWFDHSADFYLPFRLNKNSNYYYGWMRIQTLSDHSFIIRNYAYNTIPNAPIIAGDTTNVSLSLNELNSGFQISQQNNTIYLSSNQQMNHATISVFDLLGKEILQQPFSGKEATLNIDRKGIYIVEVKSDTVNWRKKVFVY